MIDSIQIQNFQIHRDAELQFSPGVNVIIGSSDSGKTAILRALNWVVSNKPSGDSFKSNGTDDTSAILYIEGKEITRHKTGNHNIYAIDEDVFKAFGQGVPPEITSLINMDSLNIHSQLAGPFLLSQSSGEVARYLNTLVNLDVIDKSISNLKGESSRVSRAMNSDGERLIQLESELVGFNWIESAEDELKELETLQEAIFQNGEDYFKLSQLLSNLDSISEKRKEIVQILSLENQVEELIHLIDEIKKVNDNAFDLNDIINHLDFCLTEISEGKQKLKLLEEEFHSLMPEECPLCGGIINE